MLKGEQNTVTSTYALMTDPGTGTTLIRLITWLKSRRSMCKLLQNPSPLNVCYNSTVIAARRLTNPEVNIKKVQTWALQVSTICNYTRQGCHHYRDILALSWIQEAVCRLTVAFETFTYCERISRSTTTSVPKSQLDVVLMTVLTLIGPRYDDRGPATGMLLPVAVALLKTDRNIIAS